MNGPSIIARLGLDSSSFQKEMGNSLSLAQTFARRLGASLGAVGLTRVGKSIIDWSSALRDSADVLNINVESLQELNYAFGQSGAGAEKVEKGLARLNQQIAAAKDGNEGAQKSFEAMGVSMEQLNNLAPDEILMLLADGLKNAKDPAAALDAVLDLLGKSGLRMAAGLRAGSAELERLRSLASKITAEEAAANDAAGDTISTLNTRVMGFGARMLAGLINSLDPSKPFSTVVSPAKTGELDAAKAVIDATKASKAADAASGPIDAEAIRQAADAAIQSETDRRHIAQDRADEENKAAEEREQAEKDVYELIDQQLEAEKALTAELREQTQELQDQADAKRADDFGARLDDKLAGPDARREARRSASQRRRHGRALVAQDADRERNARANGRQLEPRDPGPADERPAKVDAGKDGAAKEATLTEIRDLLKGKFTNQ
jgi:hypothetical protein